MDLRHSLSIAAATSRAASAKPFSPAARTALFLTILLLALGFRYYLQLSWTVPPHSDAAGMVLCAWDMLHGNFFLHGWTLDANRQWLTEAPVYMAGLALTRHLDPALMHVVPVVVVLALASLVAVGATVGLAPGFARRTGLIIAVLPLVLPTQPMIPWLLMGSYHSGTTTVVLAAAVLLYLEQSSRRNRMARAALTGSAFTLLVAGELSDPYTTVLGVAPIVIVSAWRAAGVRPLTRTLERLRPAGIAAGAWIAAAIGLHLVTHFGGFTPVHFVRPVIPFAELGESLSNLAAAFLNLGGANFFGQTPDVDFVAYAVRLAYLAGGAYAVWRVLRQPRLKEDWLLTVLAVGAALAIVAGALGDSTLAYRYRMPPLILAGTVLGRYVTITSKTWLEQRKPLAAGLIVAAALEFAFAVPATAPGGPGQEFGPQRLGSWLEQHGLTSGYGDYSIGPITTVETGGRVRVRTVVPVAARGAVRLAPLYVGSNAAWYAHNDATFLVLDPAQRNWDVTKAIPSATVAKTFGPPARVYAVAPYVVLVWDKPLTF